MDISYILFLQKIREATGGVFSNIALTVTSLGEPVITYLLLAWIYWCVDKSAGQLMALHTSVACTYNQFLKNIFKTERPWDRDSRIVPVEGALAQAGGYSFPSGHTTRAAAVWGSLGAVLWRRKEKALSVFCWLTVLVVAFSRNFLGVHTPQDVLAAFAVGLLFIFILIKVLRWTDAVVNRDIAVGAAGCLICFLPMLRVGCLSNAGAGMGFWIGWVLERHFVRFEVCEDWGKRVIRFVPGAVSVLCLLQILQPSLGFMMQGKYAGFFASFVLAVFIMAIYPFLFKLWEANAGKKAWLRKAYAVCVVCVVILILAAGSVGYLHVRREASQEYGAEQAQNADAASEMAGMQEQAAEHISAAEFPKIDITEEYDVMRVIAHRGYSEVYPENTLAAFAGAVDIGVDYIELDVQMTSDGVIVVFHDNDLKRITGQEGRIADYTYEQLQQMDAGSWFQADYEEERIPTLQETLELIRDSRCNVYLEMKDIGDREGFVEQTLKIARQCGMEKRCLFASFQYEYLRQIKTLDSELLTLYITSSGKTSLPVEYPAEFYGINVESVSADTIKAIHESGSKVFVWTLETPTQIGIVRGMGADGVVTNRAGLAKVMVHPEYSYLSEHYENSFIMPGLYGQDLPDLCGDMVVQGFTKAGNYMVVSAYSKSGEYNSILYMLHKNGTLLNIIDLQFKAHTGGIAYDEDRNLLWITGAGGMVCAIDWDELIDNAYQGELKASFDAGLTNHNDSKVASFLTYDHGELFVGSYVDGANGKLRRYGLSDIERPELLSEMEIPQRIQGITFAWDGETQARTMLLSQGYETEDSCLLQFDYSEEILSYTEPLAAYVMPEGMEQIDMSANGLYVLFESSARPYRATARLANDRIYLMKW